jgi:phosphoserine phosphatase RsbU/P
MVRYRVLECSSPLTGRQPPTLPSNPGQKFSGTPGSSAVRYALPCWRLCRAARGACAAPLRERRDDILSLAAGFLREFDGAAAQLTAEATEALRRHDWPGNVRELRNVLERALIMCDGSLIDAEDLCLRPRQDGPLSNITDNRDAPRYQRITPAISWRLMSIPRRLKCAETWSGNQVESSALDLPGLSVWVHSRPFGPGEAGGDVHYVSLCPSCIVARIALADVSGHGRAVVSLSDRLRQLMQTYLTELEQASLMRDLNEAVSVDLDNVHYATMVAVGFHSKRGLLVITNAGHPPALWYRAHRDEWVWFEPQRAEESLGVRGTPLGLLPNASYDRMTVKPGLGDLIVLYSDGVSEATNAAGAELGRDDLMRLARTRDRSSAERFGMQLVEAVTAFRGGQVPEDDETIIVLERR